MLLKNIVLQRLLCAVCVLPALLCGYVFGADETTDGLSKRTVQQVLIENAGVGVEFHDQVEKIGRMVSDNETARAMREVDLLLVRFEKLMPENGKQYISVSSDAQFIDYAKKNRKKNLVRVSWEFQKLLFIKAFILAEEKPQQALPVLEQLLRYAPYSSKAYCEQGYILGLLKKPEQAVESYQQALRLSEQFASEKHSQAIALRGLGYNYTMLGQYDKAARYYRRSLELDENNAIALDGLKHIEKMTRKQDGDKEGL